MLTLDTSANTTIERMCQNLTHKQRTSSSNPPCPNILSFLLPQTLNQRPSCLLQEEIMKEKEPWSLFHFHGERILVSKTMTTASIVKYSI